MLEVIHTLAVLYFATETAYCNVRNSSASAKNRDRRLTGTQDHLFAVRMIRYGAAAREGIAIYPRRHTNWMAGNWQAGSENDWGCLFFLFHL